MSVLYLIVFVIVLPYLIWIVLFGCTLIKRLVEGEWQPKKGLIKAVSRWEKMTPEERMEVSKQQIVESAGEIPGEKGTWVKSPTPQQEVEDKNAKVFKEGILHPLPPAEVQTPAEVAQPVQENLRPTP